MNVYDYIVVGAGSSGCALTNRLVSDRASTVLLIEAGPKDTDPMIHIPMGFPKVLEKPAEIWHYPGDPGNATPEKFWLRGRVLGGSSSINGQVYMRGRPADYDQLNIPGWSWKEVSRAFAEFENHQLGTAPDRGSGGLLNITMHPKRDPVCDALIQAAIANGAIETVDLNQEDGLAVGYLPRTIYRGRRQSAAVAFLRPIRMAPNFTTLTGAQVNRVVFDGARAVGVELRTGDATRLIHARKEIILSAGALNSPKLLMLSGIGPARTLKEHGISMIADTPQVGQNLSEQLGYIPVYRLTHGSSNHRLSGLGLFTSLMQYVLTRKGPLSYAIFHLGVMISTKPGTNRPNAIIQFMPASAALDHNTGKIQPEKLPGATLSAYVIRPRSRGYVTITSADPDAPTYYNPRYLTHDEDRQDTADLVRTLRRLFAHPGLKNFGFTEVSPGPSVQSDEQILEHFLKSGTQTLHALGTCRMGIDSQSVVDPRLRVRSVEGLRVADISILPEMVGPHTNAPAMMIGWRAGQMILEDQRKA